MSISESELILNQDGSVYHLNLLPGQVAETIITVGDPDRVDSISKHFDTIEHRVHKREFKTHTGTCNGKRLSVISTGIGTDNIDIVFNELDALVNIDFNTRKVKQHHTRLEFIRLGTSGAIQSNIPLDALLISEVAIGFDNLLHFYKHDGISNSEFSNAFISHTGWSELKSAPYVVEGSKGLLNQFDKPAFITGITATNVGFYGPQGRVLRLGLQDDQLNHKIGSFEFQGNRITNLEMETAGIYAMAKLLGHDAISLNAILANRALGTFSLQPEQTMETLIEKALAILTV